MISKKASQRSQRRNTKTKESKATKREVNLSSKLFPIMMCLTGSNNRIAGNSIFRFDFSLNQLFEQSAIRFRLIGYSISIIRVIGYLILIILVIGYSIRLSISSILIF